MSVSPRLLIAGALVAGVSTAAVIHLLPHAAPLAGRPLFAPGAPSPSPAPLAIPSPAAGAGVTWLPPTLRAPRGIWDLLNQDTAATTRGQIKLVQTLEDTLRDQIRSLLQHPLGVA
ncbi:MAG: hypothetical protein NVSMB29_00800 [Candidatus Dormibacteria bacterium]